jgi:hypothetical protein
MPPEIQLYPTKTLRYQLCNFLLKKKREEPTLGTPLNIKLREMEPLLQYAVGDRIKALEHELSILDKERFEGPEEKTVIDIIQAPQSEDFTVAYNNNETIKIRCFTKNIEEYILELKTRTRVAIRNFRLAELVHLHSGGVKIVLGDQEMDIGKTRDGDMDISVNIIKLMYGESISILRRNLSLGLDYTRGDLVFYEDLLEIFHKLDDFTADNESKKIKAFKDVAINLNERAMPKFGKPILEKNTEGLKWIL